MPKVSVFGAAGSFYCPGCLSFHAFDITEDSSYNNNGDSPTLSSRLVYANGGTVVCSAMIESGHITFTMESRHRLAGKTVDLPNVVGGIPQ